MSANQNTLYPALYELKSAALANYQPAPCEVCQGQPAKPYVIAFAKETGSTSSSTGATTTTIKTYSNLAVRAVSLCPTCIQAHRKVWQRKLLTSLAITIVFVVACIVAVIAGGEKLQIIGAGVGTVCAIIALIFGVQLHQVRTDDDKVGRNKALRLHEKALKEQGYDSFWTEELA